MVPLSPVVQGDAAPEVEALLRKVMLVLKRAKVGVVLAMLPIYRCDC